MYESAFQMGSDGFVFAGTGGRDSAVCSAGGLCRCSAGRLTLCSGPLLLSLFPFLVVSRLLIQCPESDLLALPFRLAAWGIGIRTPCAARVLCIGFLGGFAPAASAAAQAVRTGQLTAEEADALLPACICSGPSFVVLTVGQSLLGSAELGVLLFASQITANYLTAPC